MARPKKIIVIPTDIITEAKISLLTVKQYKVIRKLRGEINHRPFNCAVGEVLELNIFEAKCLKDYIKEE